MCLYFKMQFLFLRDPDPHIAPTSSSAPPAPFYQIQDCEQQSFKRTYAKIMRSFAITEKAHTSAFTCKTLFIDTMLNWRKLMVSRREIGTSTQMS